MGIKLREVAIPQLLCIEAGALGRLAGILREHDLPDESVAVVSGPGETRRIASEALAGLQRDGVRAESLVIEGTGLEEAERFGCLLGEREASLVFAVGGGKVVDVCKVAASSHLPIVSVPTRLSHDGICSPVASLVNNRGERQSVGAMMPVGVIIDTNLARNGPPEALTAGLGDLVSNLVAVLDWRLASSVTKEPFDEYASHVAEAAAMSVLHFLDLAMPSSVEALARGLVLSGLAMAVAGSTRPCSGGEHLISHALDRILGSEARAHGHQVALGSLVLAVAHGQYYEQLQTLFRRCGVPSSPSALGLSRESLVAAVKLAPSMRPDRFTILSKWRPSTEECADLVARAFP